MGKILVCITQNYNVNAHNIAQQSTLKHLFEYFRINYRLLTPINRIICHYALQSRLHSDATRETLFSNNRHQLALYETRTININSLFSKNKLNRILRALFAFAAMTHSVL